MPISVAVSPWWWWRPFVWPSVGVFFGASIASQPIIYDPGTTAIYEGDTYFVDGQPVSSATEAREAASKLANPEVAETPVPEPAMEGQPEEWLPVSVWALTQQEQGERDDVRAAQHRQERHRGRGLQECDDRRRAAH